MIGTAFADALTGTVNPERWLVDWITQGRRTSSGETINESTALTCAAVYAAVRVLAETVAALPLMFIAWVLAQVGVPEIVPSRV
ncbi:hypothetical protein LCGC14_2989600, partial [marine sediment metagenome]